jgi:hypothetical protein
LDSLAGDKDVHPYSVAAKQMLYAQVVTFYYRMIEPYPIFHRPVMFTMINIQNYLPTLVKLGSPKFRRFIVDLLPFKNANRMRDILDVMHETSVEILEAKERALKEGDEAVVQQIGRGQDIISILSMCNSNVFLLS